MLPKPVTAFALSAFVSIAMFTASSAVAAPSGTSETTVTTHASSSKPAHHAKTKKGSSKAAGKKSGQLALHSAEPKQSPKASSKELPKLPASLSTHLDLKNVKDKAAASHGTSKKTTLAAAGKEVFIGGPTGHGAAKAKVDANLQGKASSKIALNGSAHAAKTGAMSKAGRAPSRPDSQRVDVEPGSDDHPVPVALRGAAAKVMVAPVPAALCFHEPIEFVRGGETDRFSVTRCDGELAPLATERLSVLVRPESASHPTSVAELAKVKGAELAPGIRRVDPGLLARIQTIADHFAKPGMPERVSIVSGYRPGSAGSYHASAQALDFHLEGVPNEALVEFCKTLENTGCGYYPNSSFVHVDVRAPGTGHVAWIDTSGPGEAPHYVASWPPPPEPAVNLAQEDADAVNPYIDAVPPAASDEKKSPAVELSTPFKLKDFE